MSYVANLGRAGFPPRLARAAYRVPARRRTRGLGDDTYDVQYYGVPDSSYTPAPTSYSAPIGPGLSIPSIPYSTAPTFSPTGSSSAGFNWGNFASTILQTTARALTPGGTVSASQPGMLGTGVGSGSSLLLIGGGLAVLLVIMLAMRK